MPDEMSISATSMRELNIQGYPDWPGHLFLKNAEKALATRVRREELEAKAKYRSILSKGTVCPPLVIWMTERRSKEKDVKRSEGLSGDIA